MTTMTTPTVTASPSTIPSSWRDKLAVMKEFNLSSLAAVALFHTTESELQTAQSLVERGLMEVPTLSLEDHEKWSTLVSNVESPGHIVPSVIVPEVTANKPKSIVHAGAAKRGRTGNKIVSALNAISTTPQPIDQFVVAHGVSKTILRQSKRFLDTPIKVSITKDKATGVEMICRK